jgi:phosphoglycolate phosphatase
LGTSNAVLTAFDAQPVTLAKYRETLDSPFIDFYARNGVHRSRLESELDLWSDAFHGTYETAAARARTRPGARQLLAWLGGHGIRRVILSNHTNHGIKSQLDRLRLTADFELLLARDSYMSREVKLHRTKEEKLHKYLADVEDRQRVVIIGDAPEEVEIGVRAGIWTIALAGGEYSTRRLRAAGPDYLVHSLHQAMAALKLIGAKD